MQLSKELRKELKKNPVFRDIKQGKVADYANIKQPSVSRIFNGADCTPEVYAKIIEYLNTYKQEVLALRAGETELLNQPA